MLPAVPASIDVLPCSALPPESLRRLCGGYGLELVRVETGRAIPGSYWGEPEAGLIGNRLLVRRDTPVHSALHEAAHFVCMDAVRRARLHTDAGGDVQEENGVCYLQILLAEQALGLSRRAIMADMDAWGYSFRLGSASAWFERDALNAHLWLLERGLIDFRNRPTWRLNQLMNQGNSPES